MRLFRYLLLISCLFSMPTMAESAPENGVSGDAVHNIALPLTKETAAELAKNETGGRILSVHEETQEDIVLFRIKVLHDNGTVRTYRIERDTGKRR